MSDRDYDGPAVSGEPQWIQERPVKGGETVGATTDDDLGDERTEAWPATATDRDELNADQIAVIEAAADPAREYDSLRELNSAVTPEHAADYAARVLRLHWPEGNRSVGDHSRKRASEIGRDDIETIRTRLLEGADQAEIADEFGISKSGVGCYARGNSEWINEEALETPPVKYDHSAQQYQPVETAERDDTSSDVDDSTDSTDGDDSSNSREQATLDTDGEDGAKDTARSPARTHLRPEAGRSTGHTRIVALVAGVAALVLWRWLRR